MVRVTIGNNMKRQAYNLDPNTTLRTALEQAGIDYTVGMTTLDGYTLGLGDLNKTLAECGFDGTEGKDKCFLLNVVKADNAN